MGVRLLLSNHMSDLCYLLESVLSYIDLRLLNALLK